MVVAKKKTILRACALAVAGGVVIGGSVFVVMNNSKQQQEATFNRMIQEKNKVIDLYTTDVRQGYVLLNDLEAGETIDESDVELKSLPSINSPTDLISDINMLKGKVTKLPLKANTAVTSGMVYNPAELTNDLRKVEYNYVRLPLTLKKTDIIEIEIVFPNGASYSVLPKGKLTGLDLANNWIFLNANQETRYLMDSAFVDMVVNNAEVRVVQFVDGETQKASHEEYHPTPAVLELIKNNPEIVAEAKMNYATSSGMRSFLEEQLRKMFAANDYKRIGATLPEGSYVAQRTTGSGASVVVVNPDSNSSAGEVSPDVQGSVDDATATPPPTPEVGEGTIDAQPTPTPDTVDETPASNVPEIGTQ